MAVSVYVNFNGNCREAVEFYAKVFNTEKPLIMTFGDVPSNPEFPPNEETKNLVMNASLVISGSTVMFSDVPPDMPLILGNNISLVIGSKNMDDIKSIFNKLQEDSTVIMDLQETFWSKCYGFVKDKFGVGWQFNYQNVESQI